MMENEHTPGPWWPCLNSVGTWWVATYRDDETADDYRVRDTGATVCGNIGDHTERRTRGNEEANARLIAAAPDLLEALMWAVDTADAEQYEACWYAAARAAIAKARGRA